MKVFVADDRKLSMTTSFPKDLTGVVYATKRKADGLWAAVHMPGNDANPHHVIGRGAVSTAIHDLSDVLWAGDESERASARPLVSTQNYDSVDFDLVDDADDYLESLGGHTPAGFQCKSLRVFE